MTIAQDFIKKLQDYTGTEALPQKFWEDYSSDDDKPTFQAVLNRYAEYCRNLSPEQKKGISEIFWEQVKELSTPIIEERADGQSEVYFLFPREQLSDSTENPGTKKELYLQGDFHGYGSTLKETQELSQLPGTDVMCRSNTMPKDSLVTYYYVQLEPSHGNKKATDFYGEAAYQPPSFFPVKPSAQPADKPPAKTTEELGVVSQLFFGPDSVLKDEFSKSHKIYDPSASFFCADPVKGITHLGLPIQGKDEPSLGTFFAEQEKKARVSLVSVDDEIAAPEDVHKLSGHGPISRSIQVFAPPGDDDIEQVVIISDGRYYQLGNTVERLDKLLSKNTAIVCITTEQGLMEEAKKRKIELEPADTLPGMGERTVEFKYRVDEYADFIHNKLLPALVERGIKIPTDPSKRILVGSSLAGTASTYMGMSHPEWFGKVVAQSPSINNRGILEEMVVSGRKPPPPPPPPPDIFLSCGRFESPDYAKNLNLPFAEELAAHLDLELHTYNHGHQMEGWSPQLEDALPALGLSIEESRNLEIKSTRIDAGHDVPLPGAAAGKDRMDDPNQARPPEVAREISQRYKDALEEAKVGGATANEKDGAVQEHKGPSPT